MTARISLILGKPRGHRPRLQNNLARLEEGENALKRWFEFIRGLESQGVEMTTMTDHDIQEALRHLRRADPVMRHVIRRAGPFTLKPHRNRFRALVFSIVSQQISSKAAASIRARLVEYLKPEPVSPQSIARLTPEELRSVGLSPQKTAYLLDLANRVARRELRLDGMARMADEKVIEALIQVKGIGVWTAQMFLIFSLGRLDVFPHEDLGVRSAIRNLYGLDELPDKEVSHRIAVPWRPYASVASWYCWRSLEFKD